MKSLLILVLLAGCAVADLTPGLRVKFKIGLKPGTDFFFDVPRTVSQAVKSRWSLTPRPEGHLSSLVLYCHSDLTVCVYFDDTENVAGLQIALDQNEFVDYIYDMKVSGFKDWVVKSSDGKERKFWVISMYFVSEDYLKLSAVERKEKRDSSKFLQEDAIWVNGFNGTIDQFPTKESEVQKTKFTKQACTPWMGLHYYYNMKKDTECRADTVYPWFLLTDSGNVMGIGLNVAGKNPVKEGSRDWFEHPFRLARKLIVPNGPECLYDLADNPGVTTMHVYFIDKPWTIGCRLFSN